MTLECFDSVGGGVDELVDQVGESPRGCQFLTDRGDVGIGGVAPRPTPRVVVPRSRPEPRVRAGPVAVLGEDDLDGPDALGAHVPLAVTGLDG